jgi:hypothetical protein
VSEELKLIDLLESIDRKLGYIIGEKVKSKHDQVKTQVKELLNLTKDYKEIAIILGISPKHASVVISEVKKRAKDE